LTTGGRGRPGGAGRGGRCLTTPPWSLGDRHRRLAASLGQLGDDHGDDHGGGDCGGDGGGDGGGRRRRQRVTAARRLRWTGV